MATFKIGISMAGAVSAGAYTAGVLDFLTEAIDEWYGAKVRNEDVPRHDVCIEVLSGASAGGMCAAIFGTLLQESFEHVHDASTRGTDNRLFESWVNQIDIRELLDTRDLQDVRTVTSLLDSTVIDKIANSALRPGAPLSARRAYVSPKLTLFLSLTNLRGTPYSLNGSAPGSMEETTIFYGDRIRFEFGEKGTGAGSSNTTCLVDHSEPTSSGWNALKSAAMATGAFPIFLAPRVLERDRRDYTPPMWEPMAAPVKMQYATITPSFPVDLPPPLVTLNVDGGLINNDPFKYAEDYLASLDPIPAQGRNDHTSLNADRAVISIAPFPNTVKFDSHYRASDNNGIFSVLRRLSAALISQSRFFGESLSEIMTGATFSRFVIAPSDDERAAEEGLLPKTQRTRQFHALQCATLGALGGFFERGFRAHDYALGRRNCQNFLSRHFLLPIDNIVVKAGLDDVQPAIREKILRRFGRPGPRPYSGVERPCSVNSNPTGEWLPIIPLCTTIVADPISPVPLAFIRSTDLRVITALILKRLHAVTQVLFSQVPFGPLRILLFLVRPWVVLLLRSPLREALNSEFGDFYQVNDHLRESKFP